MYAISHFQYRRKFSLTYTVREDSATGKFKVFNSILAFLQKLGYIQPCWNTAHWGVSDARLHSTTVPSTF